LISSPLLYLFVLAFVATSINIIYTKYRLRLFDFIPAIVVVFIVTVLFSFFEVFNFNEEILNIYNLTKTNLVPAMIFLFLLEFESIKQKYFSKIGCACKMGAKKYWFLIALALFISLLSQIIAGFITFLNPTIATILVAILFGIVGSFTKLKELNGSSEVATTMLYMYVALLGSSVVLLF